MLDSLVRVSRRVRDDADLLAPETRAAAEKLRLLSARPHIPAGAKVRKTPGLPGPRKGPKTSPTLLIRQTQRFGAYNAGEMQPRLQTNPNAEPSRVPYARAAREPQPEPPTPNFEERLRLPPYSFTYS
jgi:hypothetical protein